MNQSAKRLNPDIKVLTTVVDFFLPRFCTFCDTKLTTEEFYLCTECFYQIKEAEPDFLNSEYERKFAQSGLVENFLAAFVFEKEKPLQSLIHKLKYSYRYNAGLFLGKAAGSLLLERTEKLGIDILLPVPLHKLKKYERGYNQSFYIVQGFSEAIGIEYSEDILIRSKNTGTQSKLKIGTRQRNITGVFSVKKESDIKGKHVAVVDDIVTTGATMNECAKVLKQCGAAKITALSIAIAG
ncbi:MAG: amidophosphoribosyltransferase [Melioribacteraceae bacterium]|nr:MAG: amidophosphoribosyltransferase [Melioribacteraceae bacterium]